MSSLTAYPPHPVESATSLQYSTPAYTNSTRLDDDRDTLPLTQPPRSSSPTPSEKEELKQFDSIVRRAFRKESWKDKSFLITMALIQVLILITILIGVFESRIVKALVPAAEWVKHAPAGFLIPTAILIILSIPPLFGAEIIHLLCGFTYGLWPGFLIVCAGTAIGESITFFIFRTILASRAQKLQRGEGAPRWAALARVIRDGGFWVALVVRFSAFPTHVVTALLSACGTSYWTFLATLVLSLPRQLAGVYLGVLAFESAEGRPSKMDSILSNVILVITIIVTIVAMHWLSTKMTQVGLVLIRERRARANSPGAFDPRELYDPPSQSNTEYTALNLDPNPSFDTTRTAASGNWTATKGANVYFGTRTPSPAPPTTAGGAKMPSPPGRAQVHSDFV